MSDRTPDGRAGLICERIAARIEDMRAEIAIIRDRLDRYGQAAMARDAMTPRPVTVEPQAESPLAVAPAPDDGTAPEALPARIVVDATDPLRAADGFHQLEYGRSGPFRWTGPRHDARILAAIDRRAALRAVVTLHAIGDAANEQALQLLIDGTAHSLQREAGTDRFHAGPIRQRAGGAPTKIALRVPYLTLPSASGGFDPRTRGVAFRSLVLEPM